MRKVLISGLLIGMLAFAGIAIADSNDVIEVTSSAKKGGKKKKPKPIGPEFTMGASTVEGDRAENPVDLIWWWDGIKQNSKKFPKCTAAEMDAAQSDSVCKKKALLAEGDVLAQLGPVGDRKSNVDCVKQIRLYNSGKNKFAWFVFGPAAQCAGVAYLPPFEGTWKKEDGAAKAVSSLPDNYRQPLPGIEGGFTELTFQYVKSTKKKKGKKYGLLESVGCKGKRKFNYQRTTISGDDDTISTKAGKC